MSYILIRKSDGKMVAKTGSKNSYTTSIFNAQLFETIKQAINNSCIDSEYPKNIGYNDILE